MCVILNWVILFEWIINDALKIALKEGVVNLTVYEVFAHIWIWILSTLSIAFYYGDRQIFFTEIWNFECFDCCKSFETSRAQNRERQNIARNVFFQMQTLEISIKKRISFSTVLFSRKILILTYLINKDEEKEYSLSLSVLTSGCSRIGTYTFSFKVTGTPSGSGNCRGSFFTPFIWNKEALTFAISINGKKT